MRKSRLSWHKQCKLIEYFVAGATAWCAAELAGVNRNTARYYYHRIRFRIAEQSRLPDAEIWDGEVEVDESYFGGHRKGRRGRGAAGKTPVFGLLKRGGRVYAKVIADAKATALLPIIKRKVRPRSIVYADAFAAYQSLDVSQFKHRRIDHSKRFAECRNHINGIENFQSRAKRHLRRFNGIPRAHFDLYLKECEWRFNTPDPKHQIQKLKQVVKEI